MEPNAPTHRTDGLPFFNGVWLKPFPGFTDFKDMPQFPPWILLLKDVKYMSTLRIPQGSLAGKFWSVQGSSSDSNTRKRTHHLRSSTPTNPSRQSIKIKPWSGSHYSLVVIDVCTMYLFPSLPVGWLINTSPLFTVWLNWAHKVRPCSDN